MYKVKCGSDLTKYFLSYSEALSFCKACGYAKSKIKPVH